MARLVEIEQRNRLDDYAAVAHLAPAVVDLQAEARRLAPRFADRTLWMVNSTAQGGGVAEMLPTMVVLLRELGFRTEWVVIESDRPEFFRLTKHLHNLIHGEGAPQLEPDDRQLYESVLADNAPFFRERVRPGDVLIVHDPQPMGLPKALGAPAEVTAVWRCHIGLDGENAATRAAWEFLEPYGEPYHHAVFSAPEYMPWFFAGRAALIYPAIDPLTPKNRELPLHKIVGVLANAALSVPPGPVVRPPFPLVAQRLQGDGGLAPAILPEDIGLLIRPIITQVSRWDRLKGWTPLLEAFVRLKKRARNTDGDASPTQQRRLDLTRLVLAGPAPGAIEDDPEAVEVLEELKKRYLALHPSMQHEIALVLLPMEHPLQNALMVNALQRASSIVVQNSLREGFGLTVTEAMWKRIPILTNARACGPRQQVRDHLDGRLIQDPEDVEELAGAIVEMLSDTEARECWGRNAQRRVHDEFLIFSQLRSWLHLLDGIV